MSEVFKGETLGERVKSARASRGMSQGDLSRKSGVSQQLISVIENRGGTHPDKLSRLAAALGCAPSSLDPDFDDAARIVGSSPRTSVSERAKTKDSEMSVFLERLAESLEGRLGFRPTPLQAVKYLAKMADPADELGLRHG